MRKTTVRSSLRGSAVALGLVSFTVACGGSSPSAPMMVTQLSGAFFLQNINFYDTLPVGCTSYTPGVVNYLVRGRATFAGDSVGVVLVKQKHTRTYVWDPSSGSTMPGPDSLWAADSVRWTFPYLRQDDQLTIGGAASFIFPGDTAIYTNQVGWCHNPPTPDRLQFSRTPQ